MQKQNSVQTTRFVANLFLIHFLKKSKSPHVCLYGNGSDPEKFVTNLSLICNGRLNNTCFCHVLNFVNNRCYFDASLPTRLTRGRPFSNA